MSQLKEHYRLLLGLDDAWQVDSVDLQLEEQMVGDGWGQGGDCDQRLRLHSSKFSKLT